MFKKIKRMLLICVILILTACRERVAEVSIPDLQQLVMTGNESYAQVDHHLYIAKSILREEGQEHSYPQYRTGKVNHQAMEQAIRKYEQIPLNLTHTERGTDVYEVTMTSDDQERQYSFVSGVNLLQLNMEVNDGYLLSELAESVVAQNQASLNQELETFTKQSAQIFVETFVRDVIGIAQSTSEMYAVTSEELRTQQQIVDQELAELGGVLKSSADEAKYQDGYFIKVIPFIQGLPQFSDDAVLSDDDPTTSARGASVQLFVTKEGIQYARVIRMLPDVQEVRGTVQLATKDSKAIEEAIKMVQITLKNEETFIEEISLIYFPTINRQEKNSEIYFTPVWRIVVRVGDEVTYRYLEPGTYKEIL